jgi:hypothetical protein
MPRTGSSRAGALLFSRYAYAPNDLGHTNADFARELLAHHDGGGDGTGLGTLARGYLTALPHLEAIARSASIDHPLDARVVEAYWVGSALLDDPALGPLPRHHNFSVLASSPWVGMARATGSREPIEVVDQCRVRWGRVLAVRDGVATVRSRPLVHEAELIVLGDPRLEFASVKIDDAAGTTRVHQGDWCALHWDWVCDRLSTRQLVQLRKVNRLQLDAINATQKELDADAVL